MWLKNGDFENIQGSSNGGLQLLIAYFIHYNIQIFHNLSLVIVALWQIFILFLLEMLSTGWFFSLFSVFEQFFKIFSVLFQLEKFRVNRLRYKK